MRNCPHCGAEISQVAHLCPSCGRDVLKPCPFCAESIVVTARICPWCRSDVASPTGSPPQPPAPVAPGAGVTERGIAATVALGFLTCGLYAFYVLHEQMREIEAHSGGRGRGLDPTRDLVLAIATHVGTLGIFPFWIYYVMYVYPRAHQETCVAEEIPCRDVLTPCALLAVMSSTLLCISLAIPIWIIAIAVLQHELNQHARLHRELGAVPA